MIGNGFESTGKTLMVFGALLFLVGAAIYFGGKFTALGRLPGDIHIERENFSFHFPIVTSIVVSLVLTVILNLFFFFFLAWEQGTGRNRHERTSLDEAISRTVAGVGIILRDVGRCGGACRQPANPDRFDDAAIWYFGEQQRWISGCERGRR